MSKSRSSAPLTTLALVFSLTGHGLSRSPRLVPVLVDPVLAVLIAFC
ncbi:hypothetical protein [Allokutzneria oryzae]|uniref:Rod shape-determining protein MreD n=1 Tax=Allokutzneria oryzae TaxID=1378989 RepID=A0ABV6A4D9_9PSEU